MINKKAWREGRRGEGERRKKFLRAGDQFECLEVGKIFECMVGDFPFSIFPLLPVSPVPPPPSTPLFPPPPPPPHFQPPLPLPLCVCVCVWGGGGGGGGGFLKNLTDYGSMHYVFLIWCVMWRDWGLSVKQRDAPDTSGRLVNVMIDIRKKQNWGGSVCGGGGRGGKKKRKEKDRRGGKREGEWRGDKKERKLSAVKAGSTFFFRPKLVHAWCFD